MADNTADKKHFVVLDRSPGVPVNFERSICFGHLSSHFSHYVIIFQAREPQKITGRHAGKFPEYMVMIRYI